MVLLLKYGADLFQMLNGRTTILHRMVDKSLKSPEMMTDVFGQIIRYRLKDPNQKLELLAKDDVTEYQRQ